MRSRLRKKQPRIGWRIASAVLLLFVLTVSATTGFAFLKFQQTADSFITPLKGAKKLPLEVMQPVNVLLIGVDERKNDPGRADAIMLLSFNPKTKQATSLSIPRDMQVILTNGEKTKINHTYAYGGVEETIETVERTFETKVPYYAKINMDGLIELVDAVGGVTVDNPSAFSWNDRRLQKDYAEGKIKLDGLEASGYARMRKQDPLGDMGRQIRQRQVLEAVGIKLGGPDVLTNLEEISQVLKNNFSTNITFSEAAQLAQENQTGFERLKPLKLDGEGYIASDGVWYFFASDQSMQEAKQTIDKLTKS
ncbi:transcriptional regulator [Exiguobacterium sp. Helios]|uniref:LCP family protein n=1 Tax=Exiguobacterium sp. Helios TaxID=2735868 RepID=UPI00165E1156|nr:LCP family protein [Exiguobacterium sp. Helios]QNR20433.1 transcriptional regulator [Exiguobacterium sp. Helios]